MRFESLYAHGFARVAACTADVYIADPLRNAESVVEVSRRLSDAGVAVAVFPELALTGYAVDDLLGQDVLLDAVHEGLAAIARGQRRPAAGDHRRRAAPAPGPAVQHRRRDPPRAGCSGVVPKVHLPNYREFYERRQFASGRGITGLEITVAGSGRRSAPTCCSTPSTCRG